MSGRPVAVFGASGHTGRFMVAELLSRGFAPVAIGRDRAKLAASDFEARGVPIRTAALEDPASLDRALAGLAAVVNCAGPFLDTADAVASAAVRARIHYLDVTAEQGSAQATFARFDSAAREAGVVVIPAMGFYGGFGDLLATAALGDWDSADEIRVGIALDHWWPTQGTRLTGQRNTARRLFVVDGVLTPLPQPPAETSWEFPAPFGRQDVTAVPLSEVIVIARHLRVTHLHTYLSNAPLRELRDASTPPPVPTDATGRSAQRFMLDVIVRREDRTRRATASGQDIYAFTAPLVVEAVKRILDGPTRVGGAYAPGELFDARSYLTALAAEHMTLEISA